jgi:Tfp pilus assembly protein PilF
MGEYENAFSYFESALKMYERLLKDRPEILASKYTNIIICSSKMDNEEKAEFYRQKQRELKGE